MQLLSVFLGRHLNFFIFVPVHQQGENSIQPNKYQLKNNKYNWLLTFFPPPMK